MKILTPHPRSGGLTPHFHPYPIKKVVLKEGRKPSLLCSVSNLLIAQIFLGIKADYAHPSACKKNVGQEVEGSHPDFPHG